MTGFGGWLLRRRVSRIALIAGLFPMGLFGIVSAAIVVCVVQLKGWRDTVADCAIALTVLLAFGILMQGDWASLMLGAGFAWAAALALGALTAAYGSLSLALQAVLVLAVMGVLAFGIWVGDPVAYWERVIADLIGQLSELGVEVAPPGMLDKLAPLMTGASAALMVISSVLALLLGTWWASGAGGRPLRAMFVQIRLGVVVGVVAILAGVASLAGISGAGNVLLVVGIGFAFQGLAVIHWHAARRGWPGVALLPVYLPLLFGPTIVVSVMFLLSTVGFLDNWFGLRRSGDRAA